MLKIPLSMACFVGLALLILGCSSSQQMTAPSSTNAVSTDPQVNALLEEIVLRVPFDRRKRTMVCGHFAHLPRCQLRAWDTELFRLANLRCAEKSASAEEYRTVRRCREDAAGRLHGARSLGPPHR